MKSVRTGNILLWAGSWSLWLPTWGEWRKDIGSHRLPVPPCPATSPCQLYLLPAWKSPPTPCLGWGTCTQSTQGKRIGILCWKDQRDAGEVCPKKMWLLHPWEWPRTGLGATWHGGRCPCPGNEMNFKVPPNPNHSVIVFCDSTTNKLRIECQSPTSQNGNGIVSLAGELIYLGKILLYLLYYYSITSIYLKHLKTK